MKDLIMKGLMLLFSMLNTEDVKNFVDAGLDKLEDKYIQGEVDTPGEVALSGIIKAIRSLLDIKDEEYGTDKK